MNSTSKFWKGFLQLLVLLVVVLFLIVGANDGENNGGRSRMRAMGEDGNMKHIDDAYVGVINMGRGKHRALLNFELSYGSKRRVPNGPDPIHNRKAGNSHQPPGQA